MLNMTTELTSITEFKGDYRFLSNFYNHPFEYDGLIYYNAEAAFQAQKCRNLEDKIKYTQIRNPVVAKRKGKTEPNLPENWSVISYDIMREILKAKFSVPELRDLLKATGTSLLIEGNRWHDNRWGACTCEKCKLKEHENRLGKILMEIRDQIEE